MAERTSFVATQLPDGCERLELRMQRDAGLFRKASSDIIPRSEWIRAASAGGMAALARVRSFPRADDIVEDEYGLTIPAALLALLTEQEAFAIGLPPASNLTLHLHTTGSIHDGTVGVERKWLRRGGMPVRVRVTGARIREPNGVARLPEPLYTTNQLVDDLTTANDPDERRARFAALREHLGDLDDEAVHPDGFLSQVRIAYAANFSLDLRTHGGLFDFDPVLFTRSVGEDENGNLVNAKESALLTEHEERKFKARFRSQKGGRRSYLLSDGTILFLDPLLGKALDVVRERQSAPADERRDFARSPQAHIRERLSLDDTGDDEAADRLFIETQQYSERVAGIEVWQKPVLPWVKPTPNSWLPESFGIRIGEEPNELHIKLEPGEAGQLVAAIDTAMAAEHSTTPFKGAAVPATPASKAAASSLADLESAIAEYAKQPADERQARPELPTYFLKVGENFETLEYSRLTPASGGAEAVVPPPLPASIRSQPKAHQVEAFAWLTEAWRQRTPGLILADDMGLGKTFEALTFLTWLRTQEAPNQPILIVAPTGLLKNWQAEIDLHLQPGVLGQVVEAFGARLISLRQGDGNDIRGGTSKLDVSDWKDAGIVLTTFETMRDYHMSFARVPFSAIVYDEIQKLKNPASQMTRAAKTLNARIQLGMTGTPVENRLQDLWSIADVVFPGFLGTSREFERTYAADNAEALKTLQDQLIERDGNAPAFMLRRMKEGLLTGLPPKRVVTYEVPMPGEQSAAYDRVLARARALRQSGDKGAMLKILHMLRGTSLHPQPPVGLQDFNSYIDSSARLSKTFALLGEIAAKAEKALIFCEDLDMQAFLAIAIQDRFDLPRPVQIINGSIAGPKRQDLVNDFQSRPAGFDVMILSPKAGGVGLTITAANHVIHLSRWWNPAVEDQATDRVYRIGQEKPVTVHIPMAVHPDATIGSSSFDIRLNQLMERKRALSRGLLVPPESDADIDEMLSSVLDGQSAQPRAAGETTDASFGVEVGDTEADSIEPPDKPEWQSGSSISNASEPDQSEDGKPDSRPVLSVKATLDAKVTSPMEAAEARAPEIRRVVYGVGGARDWTIFSQYIDGATIRSLRIIDPYCCANDTARRRLVDFIVKFHQLSDGVSSVHIISFDSDALRDCWESDEEQRRDLQSRVASKLPHAEFRHIQRSRRTSEDLHDRSVTAVLDGAGDQVIWDLGRGIDGVMTAKFACTVNAYREPASSAA